MDAARPPLDPSTPPPTNHSHPWMPLHIPWTPSTPPPTNHSHPPPPIPPKPPPSRHPQNPPENPPPKPQPENAKTRKSSLDPRRRRPQHRRIVPPPPRIRCREGFGYETLESSSAWQKEGDVKALALLLGMSIAAVVAQARSILLLLFLSRWTQQGKKGSVPTSLLRVSTRAQRDLDLYVMEAILAPSHLSHHIRKNLPMMVLERKNATGGAIAVDHLSEICTLAVRESLANVSQTLNADSSVDWLSS
ncbi:hypothetical protein RHSIM_Rhsim10G0134100 [Rhododendron simsii]|uniref:Uncharacterized protein n=1 Tax=Rhododendron simsii TaxID=118357 RepID=A0A834GAS8_RHOSS|nr:hypothetical protein RHSIM_Rhsim10G0134100 [Rhododendron simsii]